MSQQPNSVRDQIAKFRRDAERARNTPEYELEWLLLDVHEELWKAMQARGVSRSDLAERLGTSRAYVTKLLDGQENMTLKTLVRVANALEMKVATKFVPRERAVKPTEEPAGEGGRRAQEARPGRNKGRITVEARGPRGAQ